MVKETHPPHMQWYQIFSGPIDVGFQGTARPRTFLHGCNTLFSKCIFDPETLFDKVSNELQINAQTKPSDYLLATDVEVKQEAQLFAYRRGIEYQDTLNLKYLLFPREWAALQEVEEVYRKRFEREPSEDPNLIIFLGDDPSYSLTWSAVSCAIPCYRNNSKTSIFWSPHMSRFLTSREKLASMSWPVLDPIAEGLGVPVMPCFDITRAADMAGRGMHLITVGVQQLIALACFGPRAP